MLLGVGLLLLGTEALLTGAYVLLPGADVLLTDADVLVPKIGLLLFGAETAGSKWSNVFVSLPAKALNDEEADSFDLDEVLSTGSGDKSLAKEDPREKSAWQLCMLNSFALFMSSSSSLESCLRTTLSTTG